MNPTTDDEEIREVIRTIRALLPQLSLELLSVLGASIMEAIHKKSKELA